MTSPEFRAAQQELRAAEESVVSLMLARTSLKGLGATFGGGRDIYGQLGYALHGEITLRQYRERYERGGIAGRVVDARPNATWRGEGELIETDNAKARTAFETAWYAMNDRLKVWPSFQRLDTLAALGEYAVMLIGASGPLDQELPRGRRPEDLLYLELYDNEDAKVKTWEKDRKSPRYARPAVYEITQPEEVSSGATRNVDVHWSRIVHVPAEGFLYDEVYGPPSMERIWNDLDNLDKIVGGGAEAFFSNANPITHWDLDKDASFGSATEEAAAIAAMKVKAEEIRHQVTRWMTTRGVKVDQLTQKTVDFSNQAKMTVSLIAGAKGIPQRILLGSERGELASTQDDDNWKMQIGDRRTSYAGPYIARQWADRVIAYGYLPKPKEYSVKWPDVRDMSVGERLDAAEKAAKLNDHGQVVITGSEIREQFLDKEPLDPSELDEVGEEDEQIDRLEAAMRKGGTLSLMVKP